MKFAFIREYRSEHSVALMCTVLGASRSGYYAWMRRQPGARARANEELIVQIRACHQRSAQRYGSPRIHQDLQHQGIRCGKNRVARLMRLNGIVAKQLRRFRVTTRATKGATYAPDRLQRCFVAERPHQGSGLPTSRSSGPTRGGCTWQSSSTCSPARSSLGSPVDGSMHSWSAGRCR
jgi:putative transposase